MRKWHNKFLTMLLVADLMASSFQPYAVAAAVVPDSEEKKVIEEQVDEENQEDAVQSEDQKTEDTISEEDTSATTEETVKDEIENEVEDATATDAENTTDSEGGSTETTEQEAAQQEATVKEEAKAVMIGSEGYNTLQEAVNAANTNATITLTKDVEVSEKIVVSKNVTIISETDAVQTIRRAEGFTDAMFEVKGGAQLRFGKEDGTNAVIVDGGAKWVVDTLVEEDGSLLDDSLAAGAVGEEQNQEVSNGENSSQEEATEAVDETEETGETVTDTTETEENTENTVEDATGQEDLEEVANGEEESAVIEEGNKTFALKAGMKIAAVDVESPTVEEAYNAGIKANASMIQIIDGQVYVYKNTVVQNNDNANTSSGGGAIDNKAGGKGTVFVYGTVQNNSASGTNANGGAIRNNGFVNVYDGAVISGNKATKNGGAIENYSGGVMTFQGGEFKDNQAELGGAIWTDGKVEIQSGTYNNNKAIKNGGAIYVDSQVESRKVIFSNGTFTNNTAAQGQDVYLDTTFAAFRGNVQLNDVFVKSGDTLKVTNTVNGKIGVTYENPELNTTIATGNGYTLKAVDAQNITSNNEIYNTTLQDGAVKLVYAPVVIDKQPENTKGDIDEGVTLSITAHAKSNETVSYQWYESNSATGENGSAIDGATNATYKVDKKKVGVYYYYCVVNAEKAAEAKSDVVAVKMTDKTSAEIPTITTQPIGGTYDLQKEVTVTVDAVVEDGGQLTYQWYQATKADLTDGTLISGAIDKTYTMKAQEAGTFYYYCVVTNTKKGIKNEVSTAQSHAAVVVVNAAAVVFDGVPYSKIEDAFPYLEKGEGTLEVRKDITLNKTITVEKGDLVIKGEDGKAPVITLDKSLTKEAFVVNGGTLTLENVVLDGGAVWTGDVNSYLQRGMRNTGRQVNVPAIKMNGGVVNLEKGSVLRNHVASWDVSVIKMSAGTLNINGGSLFNNYGGNHGGAIFADSSNSIINMTSGTISGNQARQSTGAICADHGAQLTISGGEISNNYTSGRAGAIYINGTLVISDNAHIHDNRADANGGAIVNTAGTMSIRGGIIENNSAGGNGGGISSLGGIINLQGGKIQNNKATLGSGIYIEPAVTIAGELALDGISDDIYTSRVYTMTLDGNGVDNPKSQTIRFLEKYNLPVLQRNGYKFLGWYTAKEDGEQVQTGDWIKATKNMTLHAQWKLTATDEIELTKQLEGGVFYIEDNKAISVAATTKNKAEVSYQWYRCDDKNGTNKVALEEQTSATLALPNEIGTYYYFCVVSAEDAVDVVSDTVKVQMISKDVAYTPEFSKQPANAEVYVGEKAVFEAEATTVDKGTITYQWYRSTDNTVNVETAEKIAGATNAVYEVEPTESGTYNYFVVATNTIHNLKEEEVSATAVSNMVRLVAHGKIQVTDLSAKDVVMQKDYWNTYRVGTTVSKDGYITGYSSARGSWGANTLNKAFDGNWGTFWETNSSGTNNAVEVTFDQSVTLDRIVYATRQDSQKGKGYPTRLAVYSKDENGNYKEVGVAESTETGGYRMFTLPETVTTTGLKFAFTQGTWNNWASAAELVFLRAESSVLTGTAKISGTAMEGEKLTVTPELTVGQESIEQLNYQWQESQDGVTFKDMEGATGTQYTIKAADENKFLRVVITDGSGKFTNQIISDVYAGSVKVTLDGAAKVGEQLQPKMEYVTEDTLYQYQWQRSSDGEHFTNIEGATKDTYTVNNNVSSQYVRLAVKVSVDGSKYSKEIYSNALHVDVTALMTGAPQVDSTLKASVKGLEKDENGEIPVVTYQWEIADSENGTFNAIAEAKETTYKITEKDLNKFLRVKATIEASGETVASQAWQIREKGTFDVLEGNSVYLSDIKKDKLVSSSIGYGELMYDKNTTGNMITLLVDGQKNYFFKGFGIHAPSYVVFDVSDYVTYYQYNRFISYLGLDNGQGDKGNGVKFTVQTSVDNKTWKTVVQTGVLKGNSNAQKVDISLEGVKYLKISASDNGGNANDHSVIANPLLVNDRYTEEESTESWVKSVAQYDKELKELREQNPDKTAQELLQMDNYKKLLYQRTFMKDAGYNLVKAYASNKAYSDTLDWFMNDLEALDNYVLGGKPSGSYERFIQVITTLYTTHGKDLEDAQFGSLYKRMMIAIGLTHSADVPFWEDYSQKSDPLRRYEVYKDLHDKGLLINNAFENLTVEEMRWVVNAMIDDEEIEWLNYYVRTHSSKKNMKPEDFNSNNFTPGPYYFIRYTFGYNYRNNKYYTEENREQWQKKYGLTNEAAGEEGKNFNLNVSYGTKPKIWMVFEEGAVCGGISKTGTNIVQAFGLPAAVVGQPGHAAYLQLTYENPNDPKNSKGKWQIGNDIFGWTKSQRGGLFNGWGNEYGAELGVTSYMLLAQAALDDEENYYNSQRLVKMAGVYEDNPEEQIRLYEEALKVQNINLDAWYGLINTYKAMGKGESDFVSLSKRIADALTYYSFPMWKTLEDRVKPNIKSATGLAVLAMNEQAALRKATQATRKDTTQPNECKTMANSLLGNQKMEVATFSLDGENAGKIKLSEQYENSGNQILYSLDGGKEWINAGVVKEIALTQEQLNSITPENDILVRLQGTTSFYTIDITKGATPSDLFNNNRENRMIGNVNGLVWCSEKDGTWKDLTNDTIFEGDQTIQIQRKAHGTVLASDIVTYKFTADTDTDNKKYIPLKHISYVGTSSQQSGSGNATNALDGRPDTMWHTVWSGGDNERYITVKLDEPRYLTAVNYVPRQSGNNGRFLDAEVYVSMDGEDWMLAGTAKGWGDNAQVKTLNLSTPTYAQYIKVVGTRTVANFGSAAMLEFFEDTTVENKQVTSIEVKTAPKKKSYLLGDMFDKKGLVVIAHYDDGTSSTVRHKFLEFDKPFFRELGEQKVTVSYKGDSNISATFDVVVNENNKTPKSLTVEKMPTKLRYFVGDSLDTEGMLVKAQYEDGTEGYVFSDRYTVTPKTFEQDGKAQNVTISYKDNDSVTSDSFSVEVTKQVKAIEVTKNPTKTLYQIADTFDTTGLKISIVYADGTKEGLDSSEYSIESDGFSNSYGEKKVNVVYTRRPEIKTSIPVTIYPYVTTPEFVFEAFYGDDTLALSYAARDQFPEDGKVVIPAIVKAQDRLDFRVTAINRSTFADALTMKAVVIPNTVQKIEKEAFKGASNLKEIYLTDYKNFDDLTIADDAFSGVNGVVYVSSDKMVQELKNKNIKALEGFSIRPVTDKVKSIEVTAPNKTDYMLGEDVDFTGFKVVGTLENGSQIELNSDMYAMNAFDKYKAGQQTLTVRVKGGTITASFTMNVIPATPSIKKQPVSMDYDTSETIQPLKVVVDKKDEGQLSYQWYSNTVNSYEGATLIQGATSDSYTPEGKDQYYFVVVTNNDAANTKGTGVSISSDIAYVQMGSYEARIGNQSYATLKEAVNAANDGATIRLVKDITVGETIAINKNLTMSGHTIKRANTFKGILFQVSKGIVLLENVTVDGGAVWTGTEHAVLKRGTKNTGIVADNALVLITGGELNLGKGAVLKNNANNSNNYGRSGGAARISGGTLRMTGGQIRDNYSNPYGGAVLAVGGSVIMESGLVSGNHGTSSGGTFCIDQSSTFTMTSTENPEDTIIENNLGNGNGGAIWLSNGKATLNGGIIRNNKASNGGTVYMQGNGTLEIGNVTISGNKVENMVDGIYYANGSIKITGVPNMENDIYITGQRQLNITSDLTNIQSQIRISNPGGNVAFAVADTQEHAKAAENAFVLGNKTLVIYADGKNLKYKTKE